MGKDKKAIFELKANSVMAGVVGYDLRNAIDIKHKESDFSPIDSFISNGTEINKLFTATPSQVLGNLIILGYISAIESYFRALFRRLILIDDKCREACEKRQVSYGAVLAVDDLMLPEALFEDISFAGRKNLIDSFKNFLNLTLQDSQIPPDLQETLTQFSEICELRHCIVHRFGKFGSKNAISLGLNKHQSHIEKPIKFDFTMLQQLVTVCHNTVRITNNLLMERILNRLLVEGSHKIPNPIWTWDFDKDKQLFGQYFDTFYSKLNPPKPKLTMQAAYSKYYKYYQSI
ncbi:hypothetical protein [Chitinophaga sp. MM2321]|uniref:hypothetical protein n=1 Tax=Chitinophaga sp. MM2321 TaxID=3137178 RepID=UPI0032D59278